MTTTNKMPRAPKLGSPAFGLRMATVNAMATTPKEYAILPRGLNRFHHDGFSERLS
jgi:hypothetical protein